MYVKIHALYGLKQAARCWNRRFGSFFQNLDFRVSEADLCLYIKKEGENKLLIVLYVDDGLVAGTKEKYIKTFTERLKTEFNVTLKTAAYFLGLEIKPLNEGVIKVCQQAYSRRILENFHFQDCKPVVTPMLKPSEFLETKDREKKNFPYRKILRQAISALMYLVIGINPDLAYCVGYLLQSLENPSQDDICKLKRVLRYLAVTVNVGIVYRSNVIGRILNSYSDADFGSCMHTGRSTSGMVITYAGVVVSLLSQRQTLVAISTTEAEIVTASEAVKEIIWLSGFFRGITKLIQVSVLHVDNQVAVRLT